MNVVERPMRVVGEYEEFFVLVVYVEAHILAAATAMFGMHGI